MLYQLLLLPMSYCAVFKAVKHFLLFMVSQMFTGVFYLSTYIASLFVMNMEGIILFLWLSGVVVHEHTECPFTHRHLSDV